MRPLFQTVSMACCSLALLSLTQCGGSSSDAKGNAPETLNNTTMSIQTGIIDGDISEIPNIFEVTVSGSQVALTTKGANIPVWNGQGTVMYFKTAHNTGSLSISWIQGTPARTTAYTLSIPDLTFESTNHGVSGDQGAIISYRPADGAQVALPATTADVTVTYL